AQSYEFMGAKTIVFNIAAPVDVDALGALPNRSNPIAPVVIVGKTSAWPSQHRNAKFAKVFNSLFAIAIDVRNRRGLADPEASVNTRAQMLGKMSVKLRAHQSDLHIRTDQYSLHARRCRLCPEPCGQQRRQR